MPRIDKELHLCLGTTIDSRVAELGIRQPGYFIDAGQSKNGKEAIKNRVKVLLAIDGGY
jgi:hypothetical protein